MVRPGHRHLEWVGEATYFLPDHDNTRLWLIDAVGDGIRTETQMWRLTDGAQILAEAEAPADLAPIRGVPGGLAVTAPDGSLLLYDVESDEVVDYLGDGPAWIGDVANDTVAWCDRDPCNELMVTTGTDGELSATLGSGETFLPGQVWVEPAGRHVAAAVAVEVGVGTDFRLRIYDLRTGQATAEVVADAQLHLGTPWGAWTPAGSQFFLWLPTTGGGPRTLFRWPDKGSIEQVDLRGVLDGRSFVVMPKAWVGDPTIWPDIRVPDAQRSRE